MYWCCAWAEDVLVGVGGGGCGGGLVGVCFTVSSVEWDEGLEMSVTLAYQDLISVLRWLIREVRSK